MEEEGYINDRRQRRGENALGVSLVDDDNERGGVVVVGGVE